MTYRAAFESSVWIELTAAEIEQAAADARKTRHESLRSHRRETLRSVRHDGLEVHMIGSLGERALRKFLNLPWSSSCNTFKGPDAPHNIEVRTNSKPHFGARVRANDDDSRRVVAAIVESADANRVRLAGWILAGSAKRQDWLSDPNYLGCPMFAAPQSELEHMEKLRRLVLGLPEPDTRPFRQPAIPDAPLFYQNPVWKECPLICGVTWLPSFKTEKEMHAWHAKNCPSVHFTEVGQCAACNHFHAK